MKVNPQPLPLPRFYKRKQPWIWRCHIDLSEPQGEVWEYLRGFILPYNLVVYQMDEFAAQGVSGNYTVMKPSIDPLSTKNEELSDGAIEKYVRKTGVDRDRPLITQVSSFDKWKDPQGVIRVFDFVREEMDCQLLLVGAMAADDPEGQQVYEEVRSLVKDRDDIRLIIGTHDIMVNAIQTASDVVLQKLVWEGFGLSVTEALWKRTPVVASNVGGLPAQMKDEETGFLVEADDYERATEKVLDLLGGEDLREEMGEKGREHVKENFLITRHIEDWIDLWIKLLA